MPTTTTTTPEASSLPTLEGYSKVNLEAVFTAASDITKYDEQRAADLLAFKRITFDGYMDKVALLRSSVVTFRDATDSIPNETDVVSVARMVGKVDEAPSILATLTDKARLATLLAYGEQYRADYATACGEHVDPEDSDKVLKGSIATTVTGLSEAIALRIGTARTKKDCNPPYFDKFGRRQDDKVPATATHSPERLTALTKEAAVNLPASFLAGEYTWAQIDAIGQWCAAASLAHKDGKVAKAILIGKDNLPIKA